MPVIRGRDGDDIDILVRQHVAQVAVLGRLSPLKLLRVCARFLGLGLIDVDDRHHIHAGTLRSCPDVAPASPADANDRSLQAVVGTLRTQVLRCGECGGCRARGA